MHGICEHIHLNTAAMKMMEFEGLAQADQLDKLYRKGTFIGKLKEDPFIRLLYQFDEFYVEVTYLSYRFTVHSLRYSDTTDILEPYLPQINL